MVSVEAYVAAMPRGEQRTVRTGVVTNGRSAGDPFVEVDIDSQGSRLLLPFLGGTRNVDRPAVGSAVVCARSNGRLVVIGVFGDTVAVPPPPDPEDPEAPPTKPTTTTVRLSPKATGTARSGSVRGDTNDLYQGDWTGRGINSGMAVYRARQLSGTVTSCSVRIKRLDAGVYAAASPTLRLMTQNSLVGNPTWQDSQSGPAMKVGETRTVSLPNSWGQKLVTGQAGGIGIYVSGGSPYVRLAGKAAGFMTITLKIRSA